MNNETYKPTARLRWVRSADTATRPDRLQQWWGPNAPAYMHDDTQGEWRDVESIPE